VSTRDSGQALVETAIVMPLFVFLLLGTLQLGLMHQAQALTTYAAYRAVRAGSLTSADHDVMTRAAAAALLPMISWQDSGHEKVMPVKDAVDYVAKVQLVRALSLAIAPVEVKICGPTRNNVRGTNGINPSARRAAQEIQFDAPLNIDQAEWRDSDRTKLRVEVTFNYRMPIPFANMMIYQIARGQEDAELLLITRTGTERDWNRFAHRERRLLHDAMAAAGLGYTLPIRATYAMRMMSDLYPAKAGHQLPTNNECHVQFARRGGE
jgi:hypothetical protein